MMTAHISDSMARQVDRMKSVLMKSLEADGGNVWNDVFDHDWHSLSLVIARLELQT